MNTKELLEKYFDVAFAAPEGIKKLRELILSLAMQGKLVPQDEADQPARELLKEIEAEKKRLVQEGKIKPFKPLPEITHDEIPYDLPKSWEWVRLNNALDVRDGTHDTPKYVDVGYPLITSKNLYTGELSFEDVRLISEEDYRKINDRSKVDIGDILFAMIGSIGNPVIVDCDKEFSIKNVALFKFYLTDKPRSRYLHYFLKQAQEIMRASSSGAVQSFVSLGFLRNYLIPIPPIAEQRRIVAKIDELMARCDELEKLRQSHAQKQITIHTAALNQLLTAKDSHDFQASWHFITQHFGELYSTKTNVAELRKAILQLSIMGKLVPQNQNDQPASELLKEIEAEKNRLVKEGKIRASKPLPEIKPDEIPYDLPKSWEWVRLGNIGEFINGDRGKNYPNREEYVEKGIAWINTGHIEPDGSLTQSEMNFISREKFNSLNSGKIHLGDLVYCLRGATFGKTAIVDPYNEGAIASSLMIIRPLPLIFNRYLYWYLISPIGRSQIFKFDNGSAQPNLSANSVRLYVYPLPPLAEQHRIVAKIDQLMSLCDQLEKQIDSANSRKTNLLNSVMAKI